MAHDQPARRVSWWQWIGLPPVAAALTLGAYLLWLGWHYLDLDTSAYETWQVVGLVLTLVIVVVVPTWRSAPLGLLSAGVVTVSLTVIWCWDSATTPRPGDASFWPIGAVVLLFGALTGLDRDVGCHRMGQDGGAPAPTRIWLSPTGLPSRSGAALPAPRNAGVRLLLGAGASPGPRK